MPAEKAAHGVCAAAAALARSTSRKKARHATAIAMKTFLHWQLLPSVEKILLEIVLKPTGSEDEVSRDLNEIRTLCKADKQHAVDFAKCGGFCLVKSIMSKWRRSSEVQRCGCGGLAKASNQKKCFKKSQISHW